MVLGASLCPSDRLTGISCRSRKWVGKRSLPSIWRARQYALAFQAVDGDCHAAGRSEGAVDLSANGLGSRTSVRLTL
jgi:hypothetical protein